LVRRFATLASLDGSLAGLAHSAAPPYGRFTRRAARLTPAVFFLPFAEPLPKPGTVPSPAAPPVRVPPPPNMDLRLPRPNSPRPPLPGPEPPLVRPIPPPEAPAATATGSGEAQRPSAITPGTTKGASSTS